MIKGVKNVTLKSVEQWENYSGYIIPEVCGGTGEVFKQTRRKKGGNG